MRYFHDDKFRKLYSNAWLEALNKDDNVTEDKGNKLHTLAKVKRCFAMETYVTLLPYAKRRDFAKLRTSSHSLEIEVGRYHRPKKIPREDRVCKRFGGRRGSFFVTLLLP